VSYCNARTPEYERISEYLRQTLLSYDAQCSTLKHLRSIELEEHAKRHFHIAADGLQGSEVCLGVWEPHFLEL
jgi:hypothetical protein